MFLSKSHDFCEIRIIVEQAEKTLQRIVRACPNLHQATQSRHFLFERDQSSFDLIR